MSSDEGFGGFDFNSVKASRKMGSASEIIGAATEIAVNGHRRFRMTAEGEIEFEGFTTDEIKDLLTTYREHLRLMGALAHEAMSGSDAARWPGNPDGEG